MNALNEEIFRYLKGVWKVDRQFEGSYGGSFVGKAIFAPDSDTASTYRYTEQGELTDHVGKTFDAKQSYRYRLMEGKLQVLKQEESGWITMHELVFSRDKGLATASHVHLCGQDHYATVYRIDLSGTWEVDYTVNGPKKDYRISSGYSREQ